MANFNIAHRITLGHEGGYANDPVDRGGETYKGIARNFWRSWAGWRVIDTIKSQVGSTTSAINRAAASNQELQNHVDAFYKQNFWDVNRLDQINDQQVANEVYDTGVNMGVSVAARFLQNALNVLSGSGLVEDGIIGPMTVRATNSANSRVLYNMLNILQGQRYMEIVRSNPSQRKFVVGWFNNRIDIRRS